MKQNQNADDQFQKKLAQLSIEDILMYHLIEKLSDEHFAATYAKENNLNDQAPEYRQVS